MELEDQEQEHDQDFEKWVSIDTKTYVSKTPSLE